MKNEYISGALLKHKKWLNDKEGGERLNLRNDNLSGVTLRAADLRSADFRNSDLSCTDLIQANLSGADLSYADLMNADLRSSNLIGTYLVDTDLRVANLKNANLICSILKGANLMLANLKDADFSYADLRGANLTDADLRGADLSGADLTGADLSGADLRNCKIFYPIACPEKGSFIGFKKANGYIIELEITKGALRSSATTRKCRCSEAKVISITNLDGTSCEVKSIASTYDNSFIYTVGENVKVDNFNTDRWAECTTGIHFFITREEAVNY